MSVHTSQRSYAQLYLTRGRPRWRAARAGKAHTPANVVTAAVFHAPMFALNADADQNACAPSHPRSTPTGRRSHVSARMRASAIAYARGRAYGRTRGARVRAHAYLSQQYTHTYILIIYIYNVIQCNIM